MIQQVKNIEGKNRCDVEYTICTLIYVATTPITLQYNK